MVDRWFVHRDGQTLGPFAAAEVRDALREGNIDPFDLVSRDGSPLRRELVEVDEIFFTSKIVFEQAPATAARVAESQAEVKEIEASLPRLDTAERTQISLYDPAHSVEPQAFGKGFLALADRKAVQTELIDDPPPELPPLVRSPAIPKPATRSQPVVGKAAKESKRYYLIDDRERIMGPLAALEVKTLFLKGVLNTRVRVFRSGSASKVPVAKFVAAYTSSSRTNGNGSPLQGAHPQMMQLGMQVPNKGRAKAKHRWLRLRRYSSDPEYASVDRRDTISGAMIVVMVMFAALLAGGLAAWVLLTHGPLTRAAKSQEPRGSPRESLSQQNPARLSPKVLPSIKSVTMPIVKEPVRKAERVTKVIARRGRSKPAQPVKRARVAVRAPLPANNYKTLKTSAPAKRVAQTQPAPRVVQVMPRKSLLATAAVPARFTTLVVGQNIRKVGPLNFERAALQACVGSCKVIFNGAGGRIRVNFFKTAWSDVLMRRATVYVSGVIISQDGVMPTLLLQDIQ